MGGAILVKCFLVQEHIWNSIHAFFVLCSSEWRGKLSTQQTQYNNHLTQLGDFSQAIVTIQLKHSFSRHHKMSRKILTFSNTAAGQIPLFSPKKKLRQIITERCYLSKYLPHQWEAQYWLNAFWNKNTFRIPFTLFFVQCSSEWRGKLSITII